MQQQRPDNEQRPDELQRPETKKRRYESPALIEYGSIKDLTQFGGSGSSDFFGMQEGMGMM